MGKDVLADRIEYAILEIVFRSAEADYQESMGGWRNAVAVFVTQGFSQSDLRDAFKRLWRRGALDLTKPDTVRRHATAYSEEGMDDEHFFYAGLFNARATSEGRAYWNRIKEEPSGGTIGFPL